jgi:transposase-like protein
MSDASMELPRFGGQIISTDFIKPTTMGQPRPTYIAAFRKQIVALYRSDRTVTELADEFQPSVWMIHLQSSRFEPQPEVPIEVTPPIGFRCTVGDEETLSPSGLYVWSGALQWISRQAKP